ncbi:MAG TPA: hypothetical protein VL087_04685 [Nitrospirota bacterium]|nr:hypothetical protein [Nitrospirota bacterium]
MGKKQLLFVTYRDENLEEGVSYVVELAKAMYEDITLLLVQKKSKLVEQLGNLMTAVSFAGIDEHDTARQIMAGGSHAGRDGCEKKLSSLGEKCRKEGIQLKVYTTDMALVAGLQTFLKEHIGIDKVVLSPALTEAGNITSRDLNRLVRTSSRPIVTMTRQASATA